MSFDVTVIGAGMAGSEAAGQAAQREVLAGGDTPVGDTVTLTNPALDPISKMPEFKVCAARIKPVFQLNVTHPTQSRNIHEIFLL